MRNNILDFCFAFFFIFGMALPVFAEMSSDNFTSLTSVLSGGGAPMSSENWKTNSTLGQPSPLMQGDQNPWSANYDLYPGFWYTVETVVGDVPIIEDIYFDECISELCTSEISVSAYDPEGGNLIYTWEALDGGTITIIGPDSDVEFEPPSPSVPPDCDPYRVKVTVTSDASGLSTEETIDIYVKLAGDANGDGVVSGRDKRLIRDHFGQDSSHPDWDPAADVNCDGVVSGRDKREVRNQFGQSGCACPE